MSRARRRALVFAGLAALLAASVALALSKSHRPARLPVRQGKDRPALLILTSLPLVFGEDFSVERTGSPALRALQARYSVVSISVTDPAELARGRLLLMAQPLAQPAEDLVALDAWVRRGGRLLLFADPLLEWPSRRPLGDALRPPLMFMDTGLLAHWGLRLDGPDEHGEQSRELAGLKILTVSPGRLSGTCRVSSDRLVAHCSIGEGRVTVVADADLLDAGRLGPGAKNNLDGLLGELALLEHR
ncbi:MAG: hypothetical protein ACJ8F4_09130 [Sphingomonas sp.]